MLVLGMIGCACYMLGDQLWMFLAYGQESEELGLMLDSRWLDMPYWRFMTSILLGAVGTPLYYLGFREMHGIVMEYVKTKADRRMAKVFQVGYLVGSMCWIYVHALCMVLSIVLKSVYETCRDLDAAVAVAERVLSCNLIPYLAAFAAGDGCLMIAMLALVGRKTLPVGKWALLCNPVLIPLIIGNLTTMLPWPVNQFDHFSESLGHLAVLAVGMVVIYKEQENRNKKETGSS